MRTPVLACLLLLSCSAGSPFAPAVGAVLDAPDAVELLALHPYPHLPQGAPAGEEDDFHGYRVLGRAALVDAQRVRALVGHVERGIRASDGTVAACFNPRHGLRFEKAGRTIECLICFECTWIHIYGRGGSEDVTRMLFSAGVEPVLASAMKAHGLTKAP